MDRSLEFAFHALEKTRDNIRSVFLSIPQKQRNTIAPGFSNTLNWNLGHVVVTSELLTYKLAGLPITTSMRQLAGFRNGSSGETRTSPEEEEQLLRVLKEFPDRLRKDYDSGQFTGFEPYTTGYGTHLTRIEDALIFIGYHEGLHLGYMMGIRKALGAIDE